MGHILLDIADITVTPEQYSLSGNNNFVEFSSKEPTPVESEYYKITAHFRSLDPPTITISTKNNGSFSFFGTVDKTRVNRNTFFIDWMFTDNSRTASNIVYCLLSNEFLKSNFSISSLSFEDGVLTPTSEILIIPYKYNDDSELTIEINESSKYHIDIDTIKIETPLDSISQGADCNIELDIYENPTKDHIGDLLGSLQKNYYGEPCWFDLNSIFGFTRPLNVDFLSSDNWVDTGSVRDYRFIAKRNDAINHEYFYMSDILYCVCGYSRGLENIDMSQYVYNSKDNNTIKPLTTQPTLFHTKGQTQYFNFLFNDELGGNYPIGLRYKLYTQSKKLITSVDAKEQSNTLFSLSNTVNTELDDILEDYPNAGYVEIYLIVKGEIRSEALTFKIQPSCLHDANDFAFLNSLGGWSSLNFGNGDSLEFKPKAETFYQPKSPQSNISATLEGVYSKTITEAFTVTSSPLTADMCDYFKEIASAVSVYELSTKRYVVVEDLTIKTNSNDELYNLEMKFRYSDKYNTV